MSTAVYLTLDEFLIRPDREDGRREELINGDLIVSPVPQVWHAAIVRRMRISLASLESNGYALANDFACIPGETSMPAPDLSAVRLDRWIQAEKDHGWFRGSPELVIEVASPSNRKLHRKADGYIEYGAEQVWLAYPTTRTVTVVTPQLTSETRIGETVEFHGVHVPVASIFLVG